MLSAKLATKAKTAAAITVAAANRIDVFELPRVIPMKTITRHNMYTLGHQVALIPPELCPRGNRCTHDDTEDQASVGNFPFDPDTGNASGPNFGARVAKPT
jgi:hypothetical protein